MYLTHSRTDPQYKWLRDNFEGKVQSARATSDCYTLDPTELQDFRTNMEPAIPEVALVNAISDEADDHDVDLFYGANGAAIIMSYAVKATLKESFELHEFPFDSQRFAYAMSTVTPHCDPNPELHPLG